MTLHLIYNCCIRRKQSPPDSTVRREGTRSYISTNGELGGPSQVPEHSFSMLTPESHDENDEDLTYETLGRGYSYFSYIIYNIMYSFYLFLCLSFELIDKPVI